MQVRLVVTNKVLNEATNCDFAVEEKITIGRHLGSPVLLQGDGLSRHHFSLMLVDNGLTIEDLSSNGTWLNGALLKAQMSARVKSGDIIEVPGYEMQVMLQGAEVAQKAQAKAPIALPSNEPGPDRKASRAAVVRLLEPREAALLLFAVASFALISFFLSR
ncbi:MAG TPA: FHA domain-containing protein [Acidobacteriaceae bacterium]